MMPPSQSLRQVGEALILPLLRLCGGGGELPVISQPHNHCALQCQLGMWEVSEAGLHIFLNPAQPQEGVPQTRLQEVHRSLGWQAQQWQRQ